MLSRVADCLYWMSRYVERAENIARIVDVNRQVMLDLPYDQAQELDRNWFAVLTCLGDEETFQEQRGGNPDRLSVTDFLVHDRENPNSIVSCLCAARENARTAREQISAEMWEQINRSYLWFTSRQAREWFDQNEYDFFQQVKEISHLFQGITDASMLHGEGWYFIQIGKYIERADKTSRVLDDKYHLLTHTKLQRQLDVLEWSAVLRSCSARQAYQKVYVDTVKPIQTAELLLLNETFPRSVRFCVENVDRCLRQISGVLPGRFTNAAEKLTGRFLAELNFSTIEDVYGLGLHEAIDRMQIQLNDIGDAIFQTYIHQEKVAESVFLLQPGEVSAQAWQEQPQQQQQ